MRFASSLTRRGIAAVALVAAGLTASADAWGQAAELPQEKAGVWSLKASLPMARTEVAVAALDGKLYVLGGSTAKIDDLAVNEVYDPGTDRWRSLAPMPRGLNHVAAVALNGKIYTVGGFTGRSPTDTGGRLHQGASTLVFEYDPATDSWRTLAPMKAPRGSPGAAAVDGKIHAIGGRGIDVKTIASHEVYDPATDTWTDAAPLPVARDHMATVAAGGLIHVIGGRYDSRDENSSEHDIYDPKTDAWSKGPPLPTARSGLQFALLDGRILVVGGETSKAINTENEAYDVTTGTWAALTPVPLGLHASAGATIGKSAYFPAGSSKPGGDAITDQLLVFTLP